MGMLTLPMIWATGRRGPQRHHVLLRPRPVLARQGGPLAELSSQRSLAELGGAWRSLAELGGAWPCSELGLLCEMPTTTRLEAHSRTSCGRRRKALTHGDPRGEINAGRRTLAGLYLNSRQRNPCESFTTQLQDTARTATNEAKNLPDTFAHRLPSSLCSTR